METKKEDLWFGFQKLSAFNNVLRDEIAARSGDTAAGAERLYTRSYRLLSPRIARILSIETIQIRVN